jgi:hypothetical protein
VTGTEMVGTTDGILVGLLTEGSVAVAAGTQAASANASTMTSPKIVDLLILSPSHTCKIWIHSECTHKTESGL